MVNKRGRKYNCSAIPDSRHNRVSNNFPVKVEETELRNANPHKSAIWNKEQ
jgi:hypothetical protein